MWSWSRLKRLALNVGLLNWTYKTFLFFLVLGGVLKVGLNRAENPSDPLNWENGLRVDVFRV